MDFDCLVGSLCFCLIAQKHWKQKIFIRYASMQLSVSCLFGPMRSLLIGFNTPALTSLLPFTTEPCLRSYFYGNSHFDRHFHCLPGTAADEV